MKKFDSPLPINLRWENQEKKRYYQVFLSRDLLNYWIVTKAWGGLNNASGRIKNVACNSLEDAEKIIDQISKQRKSRGYNLCVT